VNINRSTKTLERNLADTGEGTPPMFAMISASLFVSAAIFSLVVISRMLSGYATTMAAALQGQPLPRTRPQAIAPYRIRRSRSSFTPRRLAEPVRAAA
jgi:hypothetical protein